MAHTKIASKFWPSLGARLAAGGLCLAAAAGAIAQVLSNESQYVNKNRNTGWFFYRDQNPPPPPKPAQVASQPTSVVFAPNPAPAASSILAPAPAKLANPFSVSWLKEKLPILHENAINNPSDENVRAYKYAERLMLDMATNYGNAVERVVAADPMLNEEARFPIAAAARASALFQVDAARKEILKSIAPKTGIWFVFDSTCSFCHTQFDTLQDMVKEYNWPIRYISVDGKPLKGMTTFWPDPRGERSKTLGVQITPAILLVSPPRNVTIVAHGALARAALEKKIVTAAISMNIAPPELVDVARMQERGILTPADITKLQTQKADTSDPRQLVEIMNSAIYGTYDTATKR